MAITVPKLLTTPFAANGAKNEIPVNAATVPGKTNMASWMLGFPPVTMMALEAGGIPPEGMDMNGVLNALSSHIVFQNAGGQYKFDADFAEAIGGYPAGVVLISDDTKSAYISLVDNNTENFNTANPIQNWALFAGEGAGLPAGGQPGQILTLGETGAGWTNQGNYSNVFSLETSTQLDATHFGSLILANSATAGSVITLPQSNAASKGKKITVSANVNGVRVKAPQGDKIRDGGLSDNTTSIFLPAFASCSLVSTGGGIWVYEAEIAGTRFGLPGCRIYPDGFMVQWGARNGGGKQTITFPVPFSVAFGAVVSQIGGQASGAAFSYDVYPTYLEVWPSYQLNSVERSFFYYVIGRTA